MEENGIQGGQESLEKFYIMGFGRFKQLHDILKENETRALIKVSSWDNDICRMTLESYIPESDRLSITST